MDSWQIIKEAWLSYVVITVLSTFVVMAVSGRAVQLVMKLTRKESDGEGKL